MFSHDSRLQTTRGSWLIWRDLHRRYAKSIPKISTFEYTTAALAALLSASITSVAPTDIDNTAVDGFAIAGDVDTAPVVDAAATAILLFIHKTILQSRWCETFGKTFKPEDR
jgi:hypothetical protein